VRYVVAEQFDARAYLTALPQLAGDLPPGAARFATDPDHYDFAGLRCVKDLSVGEFVHDALVVQSQNGWTPSCPSSKGRGGLAEGGDVRHGQ
jgi:hypothetical protein